MRNHDALPDFIEAVKLEKLKIGLTTIISKEMLGLDPNVDIMVDWIHHDIVTRFRTYVWSEKLQNEIQMIYPKNIWQYFKQHYLPHWFKARFPVKFTNLRVVFERRAIFPKYMKASSEYTIIECINVKEDDSYDPYEV